MKDTRTEEQKNTYNIFIKALAEDGVVECRHNVIIVPPASDLPKDERSWTLMVENGNWPSGVVVAWYRTREAARNHARKIRKVLRVLATKSDRCGSKCVASH